MSILIFVLLLFLSGTVAYASPALGDCAAETGLTGRTDVILCEPWESSTWWQRTGYVQDGAKNNPVAATSGNVSNTSIVSTGCISGSCLFVNMPQLDSGSLAVHFNLDVAGVSVQQQLFMRYYIKLSSNFSPDVCSPSLTVIDNGGKFPGLADVRVPADPSGQCGNGGAPGDGINCWSDRAFFRNCTNSCTNTPGATTRYGSYLYLLGQLSATGNTNPWDRYTWGQTQAGGGTCATVVTNTFCGAGEGGDFINNRWYLVETFIKMNTPGVADGVLRGWVDGVLSYEKTNVRWRSVGHDNLHVRTAWLNVHKGGDSPNGNCSDMNIWLDQLVLASDNQIGPLAGTVPGTLSTILTGIASYMNFGIPTRTPAIFMPFLFRAGLGLVILGLLVLGIAQKGRDHAKDVTTKQHNTHTELVENQSQAPMEQRFKRYFT